MRRDKIAFETTDKRKRRIVWYEDSYRTHMKTHPEIKRYINKLKECLRNPSAVDSKTERDSINYYLYIRKDRNGFDLYLGVIVDYKENPAFIRTCHLTPDIGGATIDYS